MPLRVLTWNLKHGRAVPSAGRELLEEFTARLEGWEWDVALLQEVPPWWPEQLGARVGAERVSVLTSRNSLLPLRRAIARRWPDAIKSNGGGANAILARGQAHFAGPQRTALLCRFPERRWVHGIRLGDGTWVCNLHASAHRPARALRDLARAAETASGWAAGAPLVLGGDFNLRELEAPGLRHAAAHDVDHLLVAGLEPAGPAEVLDSEPLSDHAPVRVALSLTGGRREGRSPAA